MCKNKSMDPLNKKILKHLVTTYVNKRFRNDNRKRDFLIGCIDTHGYIQSGYKPEQEVEEEENFDELYEQFASGGGEQFQESGFDDYSNFQQSIQEQSQTTVDPYGFNRTFIDANNYIGDKLNLLQKRGITYDETQFIKVKESMESIILNFLQGKTDTDPEKVLQTALNIYLNILVYYKQNPYSFTENKASLKNGYIFLCVFYSFVYNNVYVTVPSLMDHAGKIRLRDLPTAQRNIKMIFNGVKGYTFMENKLTINPKNVFNKTVNIDHNKFLDDIGKILEQTQESTSLGIYSIVYFVANYYYPFKVKLLFNGILTSVTYDFLNEIYEPFSSPTVRKVTDQLRIKYKR